MAAKKKTTTGTAGKPTKPAEAAREAGKETLETTMKAGTEAVTKNYEQAVAKTKEQVEQAVSLTKENVDKASEAVFKGYDEMAVLGRGTFDALVQTNTIMAKGMEVLGKEVLAYTQASLEDNVAQTKALMAAKSLKELVELQNDFARARMDKAIAETAKLTDLSVQTASEAMVPLQKRVDATVESLLKGQAA